MARFFSRFSGGGSPLDADLKRVTESGIVEVPKELLSAVVQASHNVDDRQQIMRHLRECLAEPSAKRWRRVYTGLLLVEDLLKNGSHDLITETADGHHFDLVQRLSLLEHFECTTDRRVQNMVRAKAAALRAEAVPRLQTAHEQAAGEAKRECESTCSPGAAPSSCSTASTSAGTGSPSSGPPGAPWRPEGQMVLNGIVAVGHRDDTTSESSGDEAPKPVAYREARKQRKSAGKGRRSSARSDGSSGSDDGPRGRQQKARLPARAPAPCVDLLDL